MVCAVVWEYCKTNMPLCSWPKRWGIEKLPQYDRASTTGAAPPMHASSFLSPTFSLSVLLNQALLGCLCDPCFCIRSVSLLGEYIPHLPSWPVSSFSSDVYLAVTSGITKEFLVSWLRFWVSMLFPRPPCLICISSSVPLAVILFSFEFHLYVIS